MVNSSILVSVAANACCLCSWAILYRMLASYKPGYTLLSRWSSWTVPKQTILASASLLPISLTEVFFRKHPDLKVCKATLRCCRVMAVNVLERCWRGCCSNVTLKDVWRKDIWGTTDITQHHPTSQLVSDFSEGCEKIFYQVKVQERLWRRKKFYASRENKPMLPLRLSLILQLVSCCFHCDYYLCSPSQEKRKLDKPCVWFIMDSHLTGWQALPSSRKLKLHRKRLYYQRCAFAISLKIFSNLAKFWNYKTAFCTCWIKTRENLILKSQNIPQSLNIYLSHAWPDCRAAIQRECSWHEE